MVYAISSNMTFTSTKPVKTKTTLTQAIKERRDFVLSHHISIKTNPVDGNVFAEITAK